jgi:3',5'-cyclic-AMP phosphodiesterase
MKQYTRREILKSGTTALAAAALVPSIIGCQTLMGRGTGGGPSATGTLRFIHATDTHLDLGNAKTVKWVEMLVEKINRDFTSIDFVLFGGDNFNNNVNGQDDALRFKSITAKLHCPSYSVRGNKESSPKPATDPLGQRDYAKMFFASDLHVVGRDWKLTKGPYTVLGIDTTLTQQGNGIYAAESLAFVESELKNNPNRYHILLNHQPYDNFWGGTDAKDIHKYVLNNAAATKKRLFGHKNLTLTLSGHKHRDDVRRHGHVTTIATLGFVVPQDADTEEDHRFRYVEIVDGVVKERIVSTA